MSALVAERQVQALRLFRVPVPCVEVRADGRYAGRLLRLGTGRHLVAVEAASGSVEARRDEREAVALLAACREPALLRCSVEVLVVCVVLDGHPMRPLTVAHVFDVEDVGGSVVVDMAGALSLHANEALAVRSVVPEALWRAGVLKGPYPDMPAGLWDAVDDALVRLLIEA